MSSYQIERESEEYEKLITVYIEIVDPKTSKTVSHATGIIFSKNGYILTCFHVIKPIYLLPKLDLTIQLANQNHPNPGKIIYPVKQFHKKYPDLSIQYDLAIIEVENPESIDLQIANFGIIHDKFTDVYSRKAIAVTRVPSLQFKSGLSFEGNITELFRNLVNADIYETAESRYYNEIKNKVDLQNQPKRINSAKKNKLEKPC